MLYDRKAVHDLVDKKGVIYAERPKNHVAEIVTHGDSFAFMSNNPMYKHQRKIAAHNLSVSFLDLGVLRTENLPFFPLLCANWYSAKSS